VTPSNVSGNQNGYFFFTISQCTRHSFDSEFVWFHFSFSIEADSEKEYTSPYVRCISSTPLNIIEGAKLRPQRTLNIFLTGSHQFRQRSPAARTFQRPWPNGSNKAAQCGLIAGQYLHGTVYLIGRTKRTGPSWIGQPMYQCLSPCTVHRILVPCWAGYLSHLRGR
jgi:hypothetical protein